MVNKIVRLDFFSSTKRFSKVNFDKIGKGQLDEFQGTMNQGMHHILMAPTEACLYDNSSCVQQC